ncbi:SDR family oxidoreductase [Streptosporangium sp. NPDC048865]|uniref:SDR family oxidoreductase n=1 Tax=Streptosporangium sp. NPDC048865 TaxID=3155766 RepID=UPI00343C869D
MLGETFVKPLTGRVAVITGAFSDVGEASAEHLAGLGARVAVLARRADRLDGLVSRIGRNGGTALAITVDVTDAASVRSAADRVAAELDDADLLVNNADVMLPVPAGELAGEQRRHRVDLNITGLMNVLGAFTPQLVKAAAERGVADLINTSSVSAQNIFSNPAVCSRSKTYVTDLSHHLRVELGTRNVRVSTLEPGIVDTESRGHLTGGVPRWLKGAGVPGWLKGARETAERLTPRDIAETVGFIATLPPHVNLQQVTIMPTRRPG